MRTGFYPKMAWDGIRKNRRLYLPYILTCMGMVMMYYIVSFLNSSSTLKSMRGGDVMQSMLGFGCGVIGVFALIFLFYTNSFLIRRRKKEFGLYNILGMGKWNLARILFWESVMIAAISLGGGLILGITFSKFAELGMVNILMGDLTFSLEVAPKSLLDTLVLFALIFLLILLNTMRQIHVSNPIELLHSENTGEKPPKANWIFAVVGIVILAAAYFMAVTIENPIEAMVWFFVAVIMVMIATYLLFISGSVAMCRLLQKKKNYYYKTNHFVSVSSMVYRMKRNGAGLASICILCTMVLVMLSSTMSLYIGTEDILRARYPRNISISAAMTNLEICMSDVPEIVRGIAAEAVEENGAVSENIQDYKTAAFAGYMEDGCIITDDASIYEFGLSTFVDVWQIFIMPLSDYNRLMNQSETLEQGEVLMYTTKSGYEKDTIQIGDTEPFKIKKIVPEFIDNGVDAMQIIPSMYIFVPDFEKYVAPLMELADVSGEQLVQFCWFYGFDLDCSDEMQIKIQSQIQESLRELTLSQEAELFSVQCEGVAKERADFYGLYGGLFFLGILLGVVFVFAAVLIMYYKQISEGYEDQSRFEIMQKVGMTKQEIRKSINSQVLTVFFLPLLTAGLHLAFAFPMLRRLLVCFGLVNVKLLVLVNIGCFLVFALFYVLVYRITSKAYYGIVSKF